MATKKTEVAVPQSSAVGFVQGTEVPEWLRNQEGNRGSEEVGSKDVVLPRLEIVQSQSPIKEENEDAREGMLFNSATGEVYGDIAYFIPIYFRTEYLVWKDNDSGGGFFGSFPTQAEGERRLKEVVASDNIDEDLLEVVDTPVHYGLLVDPATGKLQQIVISMAKSKAKVSRKWNSMIQIVGGDRFSRVYKISTFTDENKQGKKFKNFVVQPAGFPTQAMFQEAEKTYAVFKQQNVSADHGSVVENEAATSGRGDI